jgi:hypothetical protein
MHCHLSLLKTVQDVVYSDDHIDCARVCKIEVAYLGLAEEVR